MPTLEAITYWSVDSLRCLFRDNKNDTWLVHHLRAHMCRVESLAQNYVTLYDFRLTRSRDKRTPVNQCMHWQERHLTSSKRKLYKKRNQRVWGVEEAYTMWKQCNYDGCIEHLAQCVPRFRWAGREILHAVCTIADIYGILDDVEQRFKDIVERIPDPNFSHQYMNNTHLHVNQDGQKGTGGSFYLFATHLGKISEWKSNGLPLPRADWDDKGNFYFLAKCDMYQDPEITLAFLVNMALKGFALGQLLPEEIEKLLHEQNGWKKFTCALALHSRIGEASPLRELGPDMLKTILEMV